MKNYIAKRFQNISGGLSLDTEALSRYSDVIDMSIGDTDFITDSRIIDAAFSDARLGYTKYGDPKGDPELIDAVIKAYKEDFSIDISRENLFVTASSCMGMGLTMMALLDPGDEVIVFSPYFTLLPRLLAEMPARILFFWKNTPASTPKTLDEASGAMSDLVNLADSPSDRKSTIL